MKYAKTLAFGAALTLSSAAYADESAKATATDSVSPTPVATTIVETPGSYSSRRYTRSQSLFERVIELERRKNAWLRRTFLGR